MKTLSLRNSFCSIHPTVIACTNLALTSKVDIHNGTTNMFRSGCCGHRITDRCPCSGLIWDRLGLIISSSAFLFLCFSGASCREGPSMIDLGMKRCPMWRSEWILNRIQDFILNSFWLSLETLKIYSIIYLKKIHIWNLLPLVLAYSSASKWFPLDCRYYPMFLLGATSNSAWVRARVLWGGPAVLVRCWRAGHETVSGPCRGKKKNKSFSPSPFSLVSLLLFLPLPLPSLSLPPSIPHSQWECCL